MVAEEVTQDDLVRAVLEALQGDVGGEGLLCRELAQRTGRGVRVIREALRQLDAAGRLERCPRRILRLDGYVTAVTAYKLKEKPRGDI